AVNRLMANRRSCTDLPMLLAFQSVRKRLIRLLDQLSRWSRSSAGPVEVPRILSQEEMANALGTAREVVTRTLAELEHEGLISRKGRKILIPDRERLLAAQD